MTKAEKMRRALVEVGRRAVAAGLVVGAGGNLSARLPDGREEIVITPSGYRLEELEPDDLALLGLDGERRGGRLKESSEFALHLAAYRARPDVGAVVHLHPEHATLLNALGRPIRLITLDHAYYVRRIAEVGYHPSGTAELAEAAAGGLADADVVLLRHHGCVVVARSLELAYQRALNLEAAARATFRALLLGDAETACPAEYLERVERLEASADGYAYGQR